LSGFIARHSLWTPEQVRAAADVAERLAADGIDAVRLSFGDLHGILRGKCLVTEALPAVMRDGLSITSTLLFKDTSHRTVVPVFDKGAGLALPELQGGADIVMVPDPSTYRRLPWLPATGWMLCDLYFQDGRQVPFDTRRLCRDALGQLATLGYGYRAGLEVEFHLTRLIDPHLAPEDSGQPGTPPEVALVHQGYNYLTEQRLDQVEPILEILRRHLVAMGLGLSSMEIEFGPSQCEFVFRYTDGLTTADNMMLFRSATKQICRRHGHHASFMCRPQLPNVMSSGWHLHQSLVGVDGSNVFAARGADAAATGLSREGRLFLAGLLSHAAPATALTTPTINGYKRYRSNSLAPDRVAWARDNRGALLRVITGPNPAAARIENRCGEPAANPYLYLASQVASGAAGLIAGVEPGPPVDAPYQVDAVRLPVTLDEALDALDGSEVLRRAFGGGFVDYYLLIKRAEVARFNATVTDWEHREYFDLF
jgi:glutamine synthetase